LSATTWPRQTHQAMALIAALRGQRHSSSVPHRSSITGKTSSRAMSPAATSRSRPTARALAHRAVPR
jgi:hypothetical protein